MAHPPHRHSVNAPTKVIAQRIGLDRGRHQRGRRGRLWLAAAIVVLVGVTSGHSLSAQESAADTKTQPSPSSKAAARPPLPLAIADHWVRLAKDHEVWLDSKDKRVIVGGAICLRRGPLEMFACPRLTKEHEAIVAVNCPARFVHAGMLALGVRPGSPVKYTPKYEKATGTIVDVTVVWKDKDRAVQRTPAQKWVKNTQRGRELAYPWVFVGSGFWTDTRSGKRYYSADAGEFICVSNFPTAMLDLPVASSQATEALVFSAFTERIPPLKTRVMLVLKPHLKKSPTPSHNSDTSKPQGPG